MPVYLKANLCIVFIGKSHVIILMGLSGFKIMQGLQEKLCYDIIILIASLY